MVGFSFVGWTEKIWFGVFASVYLVLYISNILLGTFNFVDLVWKIWLNRLGLVPKVKIWFIRFGLVNWVQ